MDEDKRLNALANEPIGKLLWNYALPAIVAMAASSLYNIIDGIFIGQGVGADAIMGLAVTMPLMVLAAAFGMLVGVGAATLMSVRLGQKDYEVASKILGNVIVFTLFFGLFLSGVLLVFLDPLLRFFGASDATLPYARDFMQVILVFNVTSHMYFSLNALLRSVGKPRRAMMFTITTVLLNVMLAPLFIYVFGWGIRGAAFATVMAQIIALVFQFRLFSNKSELVHIKRSIFSLDRRIIMDSLGIGMSPFLINVCACLVVVFINRSLAAYGGDVAVGAYGISNRLLFFTTMIVIGIDQGMQPIAGYNWGARKIDRVLGVLRKALLFGSIVTCTGFVAFNFFARECVSLFTSDAALIDASEHALRLMSTMYPVIGMQIVATAFFQCIGFVRQSIFLSLTRQLIFLLPMLFILPRFYGLDGVWYAIPTADALAIVVTLALLVIQIRKFKKQPLNPTL